MAEPMISALEGAVLDDLVEFLAIPKGETIIFSRMSDLVWYQLVLKDQRVVIDFYPQGISVYCIAENNLKQYLRNRDRVDRKRTKLGRFKKRLIEAWKEREDKSGVSVTVVVTRGN